MKKFEIEAMLNHPEGVAALSKRAASIERVLRNQSQISSIGDDGISPPIKIGKTQPVTGMTDDLYAGAAAGISNAGILPDEFQDLSPEQALSGMIEKYKREPAKLNPLILEASINRLAVSSKTESSTAEKLIEKAVSVFLTPIKSKGPRADTGGIVWTQVYEHSDFNGRSTFLLGRAETYRRVTCGYLKSCSQNDNISSLYVDANSTVSKGVVVLFEHDKCVGKYASFPTNRSDQTQRKDYRWVGNHINDKTSSMLIVKRAHNEIGPIPLNTTFGIDGEMTHYINQLPVFKHKYGAITYNIKVVPRGNPITTWDLWPEFDRREFIYLRIPVTLEISDWWDYDAELRFWIYLYLENYILRGEVAYNDVWVESGVCHNKIKEKIVEKMSDAVAKIQTQFLDELYLVNLKYGSLFEKVYYLPGNAAFSDQGVVYGHTNDDVSLVLVKKS
jgi:hypothetical protein